MLLSVSSKERTSKSVSLRLEDKAQPSPQSQTGHNFPLLRGVQVAAPQNMKEKMLVTANEVPIN